ncbi:hypothetical protein R3W88_023580 [Solanum pinnatisectum]|uniref:S-protein homolog n=1 Tax=Solanum pinnatisectum TaxID=50273 RepID=A0AAV9LZL8_9SOLN|nr:hypothetical protein R3W88_023580 [Solanum pinnatisectum]
MIINFNSKFLFLSLIFLLNLIFARSFGISSRFNVYITNNLPNDTNPLTLHCKSGDDDLGQRVLHKNEEYSFSFRRKIIIGSTLYFCHFWWEQKDKSIDVFNNHIAEKDCGRVNPDLMECYWKVQEDGFYFGAHRYPPPEYWKKESW